MTDEENMENEGVENENIDNEVTENEVIGNENIEDKNIKDENIEKGSVEKEGNWFTKQSTPVKVIIAIIAVCCIGAIILVALGMTLPGGIDFNYNVGFHTENVGSHSFKIPAGFERKTDTATTGGSQMVTFRSTSNDRDVLIITAFNKELDLEKFAENFSKELGSDGEKITINGKEAYKFKTTENGETAYLYILTIDGKTYDFVISDTISNPDQFISDLF